MYAFIEELSEGKSIFSATIIFVSFPHEEAQKLEFGPKQIIVVWCVLSH
jgi:hypothetical protein